MKISKVILSTLAAGAALVLLESLFLEKYYFRVKRFAIGIRDSTKKIRILHLTDLHFIKYLQPFHKRLARTINALRPHVILVSGDIIDQFGEPDPARRFFGLLDPSIPKLAIAGNHDHKNSVSKRTLKSLIEHCNGHLLINETIKVKVGDTVLTVTGVDDFIEGEGCFDDSIRDTGREAHHFMLVHSPLQQEQVISDMERINAQRPADQRLNIQYIFAGHNHGGQVRLGPIVPILPEQSGNYINGWYNDQKPYLYVSKGFGTSAVPFRFGARSEITLFEYGV